MSAEKSDGVRAEIAELRVDIDQLSRMASDIADIRVILARAAGGASESELTRQLLTRLQTCFDGMISAKEANRIRQTLAERSEKLAKVETLAYQLTQENERLRDAGIRAENMMVELNALRYRFEHAEAILTRFRSSISWKVTAPIRWIGRNYNRIIRRGRR